jgi:hypothetical protein
MNVYNVYSAKTRKMVKIVEALSSFEARQSVRGYGDSVMDYYVIRSDIDPNNA